MRARSCCVAVVVSLLATPVSSQPSIGFSGSLEDYDFRFDLTGLPAVSSDGLRVVAAESVADGGRGNPNLTLRLYDVTDGRELAHALILSPDEYHEADQRDYGGQQVLEDLVERRLVAARDLLDGTTWVPLERLEEDEPPAEIDTLLVDSTGSLRVEHANSQVAIRGAGAPEYRYERTLRPLDDECTWSTFLGAWASTEHDAVVLRWWFSADGYCGDVVRTEVVSHRRVTAPALTAPAGAYVDARAAETRLRFGVVQHESEWQPLVQGGARVSTRLRPGADATLERQATSVTIGGAPGEPIETVAVPADADVLLGDVLDPPGRRGERLDEIVVVASDGSTVVYGYDWASERRARALILPAADPRECRAAAFDGAWGLLILPGRSGGTALAVGEDTRLLRWSPTGWCSERRARTISPSRAREGDEQSVTWAVDINNDGAADSVTVDAQGFAWQAAGSDTPQRIEIEPAAGGWDPMYHLDHITDWLRNGRTAFLISWSFDSDPSDADSYGSEVRVYAPAADGGIVPLIESQSSGSGSHHYNEDETEMEVEGHYESRDLFFQRIGDTTLLLKRTRVDDRHLEPRPSERRMSWSWFYIGDAGQLEVDHNYHTWSGAPEEEPPR